MDTKPGRSTLLTALRDETAPLHDAVESALGLVDEDLTLEHYAAVLVGFNATVPLLEARIAQRLPSRLAPFLAPRCKARCLRDDLAWLRATRPEVAAAAFQADAQPADALGAPFESLPAIDTAAEALGVMYVLEGASLGGRVIARHLERHLGLSNGRGYSYFCAYGTAVGAMWQQFRATIVAEIAPAEHRLAIDAAVQTFRALERHCVASIAHAAANA